MSTVQPNLSFKSVNTISKKKENGFERKKERKSGKIIYNTNTDKICKRLNMKKNQKVNPK
jgi:hypothetical protein